MKILHVTKKYPNALGGDSVVVSNLEHHQRTAGHQIVILTSNCKIIKNGSHIYKFGLPDTPADLDNITIRRLVSLLGLFFVAFVVLAKERPNVIHTHSVDMAFVVSFVARLYRIPLVHTFHIVTFYDKDQSLLRRRSELWLAKAAGLRVITAPNLHDVAQLHKAGLSQTVLLPNGVDLEFWQPDPTAAKAKGFCFLSFGRLEPQKGLEYLIKAVPLLTGTSRQLFRVIIVGEGSQKKQLQKLAARHGVQDVIEFVGRKTPEEVRALLSRTDAAIFSSLYETTPLTLLEAWAVGVPVVVTPVGILRGAPQDTSLAYLAQPKNEHSLLSAMQRCMNDKISRKRVATIGHQEAKKYAWPTIARRADALYQGVV